MTGQRDHVGLVGLFGVVADSSRTRIAAMRATTIAGFAGRVVRLNFRSTDEAAEPAASVARRRGYSWLHHATTITGNSEMEHPPRS